MDESKTWEVLEQLSGLNQNMESLLIMLKNVSTSVEKQSAALHDLQELQKQKNTEILNRLYRIEAKLDMLK